MFYYACTLEGMATEEYETKGLTTKILTVHLLCPSEGSYREETAPHTLPSVPFGDGNRTNNWELEEH